MHSFVLDALDTTGADTFSHFEMLIEEHREICASEGPKARSSRLIQLVPTCGTFHTYLPLRRAFDVYNAKYGLTKRKHICISFNELRHILNLAQIMALCSNHRRCYSTEKENEEQAQKHLEALELRSAMDLLHSPAHLAAVAPEGCPPSLNLNGNGSDHTRDAVDIGDSRRSFRGPIMITFDGDQTLYSDGANFESNQEVRVRDEEIPSLQAKFCQLMRVVQPQLEMLKVTRYSRGQFFTQHSDAIGKTKMREGWRTPHK